MKDRIHLVVREDEEERYRKSAERSGLTLSEWLREAAREKLASEASEKRIETVEELEAFFAEIDSGSGGRFREVNRCGVGWRPPRFPLFGAANPLGVRARGLTPPTPPIRARG